MSKNITYQFDFEIQGKVKIIPLNIIGVVVSLWIGNSGIQYEVRYFDNAEARTVYFYSDELECVKNI